MQDARYDELTPAQRQAVFHVEGPLLVLAGPGSGKTRVITHRIAALIDSGVRPYNICAITFTNKAANEMRQRAVGLGASGGAHISTFHSLCVRILREYGRYFSRLRSIGGDVRRSEVRGNFSIYNQSDQSRCVKQAVKECELDAKNFAPGRMLEAISTLKNKLIDAGSFESGADDFFSKTLARIYSRYQAILNEHNALDFDDLLMDAAFLLEGSSEVRSELGKRFRFLLVDEYQDTNHAQYRIAKALASGHGNICVTGDPDQSIYRWRGADISNILAFEEDWPDASVVKLEENFRSTANILAAADKLISFNERRKEKKLVSTKPAGRQVSINVFEDESEEAQWIARQIKDLQEQGRPLSEVAVFYRVNAMSRSLEEAFIRHKIAYQVVRGVEFYNRKEIRDVLAYLRVLVNPADEVALLRIINTPTRGIGKTTIERVRQFAASNNIGLFEGLKRAAGIDILSKASMARIGVFVDLIDGFKKDIDGPVAALVERVFVESGFERWLQGGDVQGQSAAENIGELISGARLYDAEAQEPGLLAYLQQTALFSDTDAYDSSSERVAFMTLHAAKGLEFEEVFIVGLEDGLLPHEKSSDDEDDLEEERRLFFVGVTRAKSGLNLSYVRYRTFRGQLLRTIPSQFLFELGLGFDGSEEVDEYAYDQSDGFGGGVASFRPGQLVRHKTFGIGTVKEFVDMGENSVVVVRFTAGQTKTLMVKYAGLLKL